MSRASRIVIRSHSPRPLQASGTGSSDGRRAAAGPRDAPVCTQDVARACSRWSSSCTALFVYGEPGVYMDFEETEKKLAATSASLAFDLPELTRRKKWPWTTCLLSGHQIQESGDYNLEGLFIRLSQAVKSVKAKRVVLDSIEALFTGLTDSTLLRNGTLPAVSLAGESRTHRGRDRRGGRPHADPSRAGGIHRRLRDFARPPGHGADRHAAPPDRQVPGNVSRHRRVPVPDRCGGHLGGAAHGSGTHPCRHERNACRPEYPRWTGCWKARGSSAAAACSCRARRAPGSPA